MIPTPFNHRKLYTLLGASLVLGLVFEYFVGFPQFFEGRIVTRQTQWMAPSSHFNIPFLQKNIYYSYRDDQGKEIKHGPFRIFNGWCDGIRLICYSYGSYEDGTRENTWVSMDGNGQKLHEEYYRDDKQVGMARYHAGTLSQLYKALYQNDSPIGSIEFQEQSDALPGKGQLWTYHLNCNGNHQTYHSSILNPQYEKCSEPNSF